MDSNSQSPTICQRLVNFMLSMSIRPATFHPVPVENGSSVHEKSPFKSINEASGADVVVEFRHTDLDGSKASIHASKKDGLISVKESTIIRKIPAKIEDRFNQSPRKKDGFQIQQESGRKDQEKELQDFEILKGTDARFNRSTPPQESVGRLPDTKYKPLRPLMPVLRSASDINKKADEFIETRKEAMRKSYHLDNE